MTVRRSFPTDRGVARLVFTDRDDGDFAGDGDPGRCDPQVRALSDRPWSWVRQVHGDGVVVVTEPGGGCGLEADALVTAVPDAVLTMRGADCPLVGLFSPEGVLAVAHAGWRGLVAGVLPRTVATMRSCGATEVSAVLGPCISAGRYEFGADDLEHAVAVLGAGVRGRTGGDGPALDLVAGVVASLATTGVTVDLRSHRCTAGDPSLYSHRARGDRGRHLAAIWLEPV